MAEPSYDVAIVGYGPVGALSGLLLAEAGLSVAILERSRDPVELPRAVGLDGESVRAFQRIGLGDALEVEVSSVDLSKLRIDFAWGRRLREPKPT